MTYPGRSLILALGALVVAAPALLADKIYQTDGRVLEDVRIQKETIEEITFKKGRDTRTVASDKVLRVEYQKFPRLLQEAEQALAEDDFLTALDTYDAYSEGQIRNPSARASEAWAPPYAAWKCVAMRMEVADLDGAITKATTLIKTYPNSRYVPFAYLAKASAQLQANRQKKAASTLTSFAKLIESKNLNKRWDLECRLAKIQADHKASEQQKRDLLKDIVREAGTTYPTVKSRAKVVEGETFLAEAEANRTDEAKAQGLRDQAQKVFEEIIANPKADDETLAGAYTGLGDCLWYVGWQKSNVEKLEKALLCYLRVAVNYEKESRYVPKALFYAMRCFDLLSGTEDEEAKTTFRRRRYKMKSTLLQLYPDSAWAREAEANY